jgi:hypothetical protein
MARQAHDGAKTRENEDPEEHRALVVSPHARQLVDEGFAECEFSITFWTEKSEVA